MNKQAEAGCMVWVLQANVEGDYEVRGVFATKASALASAQAEAPIDEPLYWLSDGPDGVYVGYESAEARDGSPWYVLTATAIE